jgi:hypothetical protein
MQTYPILPWYFRWLLIFSENIYEKDTKFDDYKNCQEQEEEKQVASTI